MVPRLNPTNVFDPTRGVIPRDVSYCALHQGMKCDCLGILAHFTKPDQERSLETCKSKQKERTMVKDDFKPMYECAFTELFVVILGGLRGYTCIAPTFRVPLKTHQTKLTFLQH